MERWVETPEWINQMLLDTFGVDDFGDPLYRVIWGMMPVRRVSKPEGGYEDRSCNTPEWLLQRKMSPAKWGSPALFRLINKDPANNQLLFPYPEYGFWEIIKSLGDKPIDYEIMHSTIPFLEATSHLTNAQIRAYKDRQKAAEEKADVDMVADRLYDALPSRYGPVSYGRGGCRTSVLDKRMEQISRIWDQFSRAQMANMQLGLKQHRTK